MELESSIFTIEVIWALIGAILFLLELVIPGLILVFFGIGAWITAAALLLFDLSFNAQLAVFVFTSLGSLFSLRHSIRKKYNDSSDNNNTIGDNDFIGKQAVCLTAISPNKEGTVEFNGSRWEASSTIDILPNTPVKIIGLKSIKLIVEPLTT